MYADLIKLDFENSKVNARDIMKMWCVKMIVALIRSAGNAIQGTQVWKRMFINWQQWFNQERNVRDQGIAKDFKYRNSYGTSDKWAERRYSKYKRWECQIAQKIDDLHKDFFNVLLNTPLVTKKKHLQKALRKDSG